MSDLESPRRPDDVPLAPAMTPAERIAFQAGFLKSEYEKIKAEQTQRIGFRDNMLYVHLGATGAIASWAIAHLTDSNGYSPYALLVVPWVCVILGWTYVVNDHHISRMGKYVRTILDKRVSRLSNADAIRLKEDEHEEFDITEMFGWEPYHRLDKRRESRKVIQLLIDEFTFVFPGATSLLAYFFLNHWNFANLLIDSLVVVEAVALAVVACVIVTYADMVRTK